jgi:hypothetical protein
MLPGLSPAGRIQKAQKEAQQETNLRKSATIFCSEQGFRIKLGGTRAWNFHLHAAAVMNHVMSFRALSHIRPCIIAR